MVFQRKKDSAKTVPCKSAGNFFLWIFPRYERKNTKIQKRNTEKIPKIKLDKIQKKQSEKRKTIQKKKDKGIPKKAGGTGPAKLPKSRHFAVKDYGKFLFPKGRRRPSFFICSALR